MEEILMTIDDLIDRLQSIRAVSEQAGATPIVLTTPELDDMGVSEARLDAGVVSLSSNELDERLDRLLNPPASFNP
jgi:hypothetical protein